MFRCRESSGWRHGFALAQHGGIRLHVVVEFERRVRPRVPAQRVAKDGWGARYTLASPISSAIRAPRFPSGLGKPSVLSRAVWCSISALISPPSRMIAIEIHIQIMKPITAPSEP